MSFDVVTKFPSLFKRDFFVFHEGFIYHSKGISLCFMRNFFIIQKGFQQAFDVVVHRGQFDDFR